MSFAVDFARVALPRLRKVARDEGWLVGLDCQSFGFAWDTVMARARQLGATHLPEDKLTELSEWISSHVLAGAEEARRDSGQR